MLLISLVLVAVLVPAAAATAGPAGAPSSADDIVGMPMQEPPPDVTQAPAPGGPAIIPAPNSGTAPTDAGDRGGALQTVLFVLVLAGTGGIGLWLVRTSRRARAERGF